MPLPSLCSSVGLVTVAHQPPHSPVAARSLGPIRNRCKGFPTQDVLLSLVQSFYLFFCCCCFFRLFFWFLLSYSIYNISLKLPNAFLKQGSEGIQNHRGGCSLGLFLSRLCWVPKVLAPPASALSPLTGPPGLALETGQLTSSSGRGGPQTHCVQDRPGRCSMLAGTVKMLRDPSVCCLTSMSI